MRGFKEMKRELTIIMTKEERETLSNLLTQIEGVFIEDFGIDGDEMTFSELTYLINDKEVTLENYVYETTISLTEGE